MSEALVVEISASQNQDSSDDLLGRGLSKKVPKKKQKKSEDNEQDMYITCKVCYKTFNKHLAVQSSPSISVQKYPRNTSAPNVEKVSRKNR